MTLLNFILLTNVNVYPSYKTQIAGFIAKKTSIKVPAKYVNFANIFFLNLTSKFLKYTRINNHAIELVNSQ